GAGAHPPGRARGGGVAVASCPAPRPQRLVLEQRPALNCLVHAHQALVEDPTRPDRQVAHLRVAHLARRQPDGLAGGVERRVRVGRPEAVEDGRLGEQDGGAGPRRSTAPAVPYHKGHPRETGDRRQSDPRIAFAAARQMAVNDSTSSEAPPTRAPSTSGWAISAAALSGLTEPPYSTGASISDLIRACASCASSGVAVLPVPI